MRVQTVGLVFVGVVCCLLVGCGGASTFSVPSPHGFLPGSFRSVSPDGTKLARMIRSSDPNRDGRLGIYEVSSGRLIRAYMWISGAKGFAWHPDSRHFAVMWHYGDPGHSPTEVEIYDLEAQADTPVALVTTDFWYHEMHFSQDGQYIVFGGGDRRVPVPPLPA